MALDSKHLATSTKTWAGDFDCSVCRRKRLIGAEFSKAQLTKYRSDPTFKLKCKKCVDEMAEKEKQQANATKPVDEKSSPDPVGADTNNNAALVECSACLKMLEESAFNKNQRKKGPGKQRCLKCVEVSEAAKEASAAGNQEEKLAQLREKTKEAEKTGDKLLIAKAAAAECAAEAELVTGLKPVVLGRGGKMCVCVLCYLHK
jgi:hypothetical protein